MILHDVKVHPSKDNLKREDQLAWKIAAVAADKKPTVANEFSGPGYRVINFVADLPVRIDQLLTRMPGEENELGAVIFVLTELQIMDAETARAYQECSALTDTATQTEADINQDIAATRSSDLQHSSILRAQAEQLRNDHRDRSDAILASCMQAKGYTQRPK